MKQKTPDTADPYRHTGEAVIHKQKDKEMKKKGMPQYRMLSYDAAVFYLNSDRIREWFQDESYF